MNDFSQMKLEDYVQILYRRKWWVVVPTFLFFIGGLIVHRFLPKYYVANTLVLVEGQKIPKNYVESTVTTELEDRLQTIQEEVMSRSRLYEITERFNLFPDLRGELSTDQLIAKIRKNISVQIKHDAFSIYYSGRDPKVVAQVANALTQQFINENLKHREAQAHETANFMDDMLREQQEELKKQETELAEFLRAHPGQLSEHLSSNIHMIEQFNTQLANKREELIRTENAKALLEQEIKTLQETPPDQVKQTSMQDVLRDQLKVLEEELSLLKISHTDSHPKVQFKRQEIENVKAVIYKLPKGEMDRIREFDISDVSSEGEKGALLGQLQNYIEDTDMEISKLEEEQAQLQQQLITREELLKRQEASWADFLAEHPDVLPEPMDKNVREIEQLNVQIMTQKDTLDDLRARRESFEQKILAAQATGRDQLSVKEDGLQNKLKELKNELTLLKANYTISHPEVQAKIKEIKILEDDMNRNSLETEDSKSPATVAEAVHDAKIREFKQKLARANETINFLKTDMVQIQEKMDLYNTRVENAPKLDVQLKELTRKYAEERKQYEELLAKRLDAELARKLELRQKGEQFIQIDEAVPPEEPYKPKKSNTTVLSLALGLGLGLGSAFLREHFDRTFFNAKDLEKSTGVRVLASIPYVPGLDTAKKKTIFGKRRRRKGKQYLIDSKDSNAQALDQTLPPYIQEFYRVLKVKIEHQFSQEHKSISFLITSTAPMEGKTTTAVNLAWTMTKGLNKKVVILECDFYKPKVASYLGIKPKVGLCDYLNGNVNLKDVLIPVVPSKLSVISAGTNLEKAEEALESERMCTLLTLLKSDFDYVIIDTPSVMATIHESNTLTPLVDGILFVVRAEEIPRDHVTHALGLISKEKLLGAILNVGPVPKRASYKRYSEYKNPVSTVSRIDSKRRTPRKDLVLATVPKSKTRDSKADHLNISDKKHANSSEKRSSDLIKSAVVKSKPTNGELKKQAIVSGNTVIHSAKSRNNMSHENDKKIEDDFSVTKIRQYLGSNNNGKGLSKNNDLRSMGESRYRKKKFGQDNLRPKPSPPRRDDTVNEPIVSKPFPQKAYIRMILDDKNGRPYADKDYMIVIDGKVYTGKTNAHGLVDQEIPANAKSGELTLRPNQNDQNEVLVWPLHIDNASLS